MTSSNSSWKVIVPIGEIDLFRKWAESFGFYYTFVGTTEYTLFADDYIEFSLFVSLRGGEDDAEGIREEAGCDQERPAQEGCVSSEGGQGGKADRSSDVEQGTSRESCYEEISQEKEMIIHPPHYASKDIECIDYIHAQLSHEEFAGYLRGNAIKYLSRFGTKDAKTQDAAKAIVYLGWLFAHEKGELEGEMPSMIVDRLDITKILDR